MTTQDSNVPDDTNDVPAYILVRSKEIAATTLCVAFNTQACDSSAVLNRIRELDGVDAKGTNFLQIVRFDEETAEIPPDEYQIDETMVLDPDPTEALVYVNRPEDLRRVQAQIAAIPGVDSVYCFGSGPA